MSALMMPHAVFLHVPKTGGTWATEALRRQGIVVATLNAADGSTHPTLSAVRAITALPVIAAVREPVGWLRSFWRFFMARAWRGSGHAMFDPLLAMATDSFPEFVGRYLHRRPGYVSELLRRFADGADHVCRQEHLQNDLSKALSECGQPFLVEVLDSTPRANVSRQFAAALDPGVEAQVREVDAWLFDCYYAREEVLTCSGT